MTSENKETIDLKELLSGAIVWEDSEGNIYCRVLGDADIIKVAGLLDAARFNLLEHIGVSLETPTL